MNIPIRKWGRIAKAVPFLLVALLTVSPTASAASVVPYTTYTYSYTGDYQVSPDAFEPDFVLTDFPVTPESGDISSAEQSEQDNESPEEDAAENKSDAPEALTLKNPSDLISDDQGRLYIADTGNNRVLILSADYRLVKVLTGYPQGDETVSFKEPQGIFVSGDGRLYVADTGNGNLVEFTAEFVFSRIIPAPSAELLPEGFAYEPTALAVDPYDRFYVISAGTNMGVITFDQYGVFEGFIGAAKVQASPLDKFWKALMTEEQLSQLKESVPSGYNDIAIDRKGFVYVTSSSVEAYTLQQMVSSRQKSSPYSPVKKLNPAGDDVLGRTGFFPPVGDLTFDTYAGKDAKAPSALTEVAVRDNDVYSLVDSKYNKIFTYDEYGNLLYAFGGTGRVAGQFQYLQAIAYQNDDTLAALDRVQGTLTVFRKTGYGKLIDTAINLQRERKFSETVPVWQEIEKYNNNYDLAYMGIGKALHGEGKYKEAMSYFEAIGNKDGYSKAFKKYREGILQRFAILIPIVVVVLIWLILKFFRFSKKYNAAHRAAGKRTLREEMMYGFHVILHPFDGFWDLKFEKRGSVRGATVWLLLAALAMVVKDFLSGYLMTDTAAMKTASIGDTLINLLLPFVLWCVANWCLTTLMDGKGSLKDIYVATAYALIPLVLLVIPFSVISNFLIAEELAFVQYAVNAALLWSGVLIFFGSMTTHDYTLGKNIVVCILTIVGIAIILFLGFLFINVVSRLLTFIGNIITELTFRL